jgi:transcriptional regulator with XRE-family HTH domain
MGMSDRAIEVGKEPPTMATRLRRARETRGMSQRELAARISVSPSMISQIEAGQSQPSVNTLYAIVTELNISLDDLFDHRPDPEIAVEPDPSSSQETNAGSGSTVSRRAAVIRPADRSVLRLETGVTWQMLNPSGTQMDMIEVVYEVGGTSSRDGMLMRHNSAEYGLLLSGELSVQVGFDVHHLSAGDSIAFDSTIPHRLWNPGQEPARAIWVVLAH